MKISLNMWKIMVHVLLKSGLENFEYYFASMWDECNCVVVWTFFGIAFLGDWNEDLSFHPVAIAEFKLDLEKAEEPEIKLLDGKAREFQQNIYFCFIDYTNAFDWVDHNKA